MKISLLVLLNALNILVSGLVPLTWISNAAYAWVVIRFGETTSVLQRRQKSWR